MKTNYKPVLPKPEPPTRRHLNLLPRDLLMRWRRLSDKQHTIVIVAIILVLVTTAILVGR